jgi:integrase
MAKVLTQAALDALKPSDKRREVPDARAVGLYFILQPSGKASWAYRYKVGKTSKKLTLGSWPLVTLAMARDRARKAAVERFDGVDPVAAKRAAKAEAQAPALDTIEVVVEDYLTRHARKKTRLRSWQATERHLRNEIVRPWGKRRLSSIRRAEVIALLDKIADRAPVVANLTLAAFRHLCKWAINRGLVEMMNPAAGIDAPTKMVARKRALDDRELAALWRAADGLGYPAGPIVQLLILTGARLREVSELRWSEIDLGNATWTLPRERAKNDNEHSVPLAPMAIKLLESVKRLEGCPFVFSFDGKAPVSGMTRTKHAIDAAMRAELPELPSFVLHDIRRTVATGLQKLGVRLEVTEAVLNHVGGSRDGIIGVYQTHDYAPEKRVALQRWADHVERIVSGETAANVVEMRR